MILWSFGESGEALLMLGRVVGFLALEKNGSGELNPVPVKREVGVVDIGVGFRRRLHKPPIVI